MPSYEIRKIVVDFPYEAYPCQLTFMEKVIQALQEKKHGLLESPTGTGKTLCLLCATLGWRLSAIAQLQELERTSEEPIAYERPPRIIYASRTHSQIKQVIKELKATSYKPKISVLGSREQLCIHPQVSKQKGQALNHKCRALTSARACGFHIGVEAAMQKLSLSAHQEDAMMDIEDLHKMGKQETACPFFLSRELEKQADIVFMPYNYLIDGKTRRAMQIDLDNAVVIFDEAHNLEGISSDAASFDLTSSYMAMCIGEVADAILLMQKALGEVATDLEELKLFKGLLLQFEKTIDDFVLPSNGEGLTLEGHEIFEILAKVNITPNTYSLLLAMIDKVTTILAEASEKSGGRAAPGLQYFSQCVRLVFNDSMQMYTHYYKVHIQVEKQSRTSSGGRTFSFWCFNPGLAFQDLMRCGVRNVILCSGTLSPMESFAHELSLAFDIRLENPHVIQPQQVSVCVIGKGPTGKALNSSFKTRDSDEYKSELGMTVVNVCRMVPDGVLVFFPSYAVLQTCIDFWQRRRDAHTPTLWETMHQHKQPVVEPRDSASLATCMADFQNKIRDPSTHGAVFFAVCRGKVSEGLDFADRNGRAVIVTGLPFPSHTDPKVRIKRRILDDVRRQGDQSALTGNDWYTQQAMRAVNQAIGRVIRHRFDYGAILLCDERFANKAHRDQLSLWLRPHVVECADFGRAARALSVFFKRTDRPVNPKTEQAPVHDVLDDNGEPIALPPSVPLARRIVPRTVYTAGGVMSHLPTLTAALANAPDASIEDMKAVSSMVAATFLDVMQTTPPVEAKKPSLFAALSASRKEQEERVANIAASKVNAPKTGTLAEQLAARADSNHSTKRLGGPFSRAAIKSTPTAFASQTIAAAVASENSAATLSQPLISTPAAPAARVPTSASALPSTAATAAPVLAASAPAPSTMSAADRAEHRQQIAKAYMAKVQATLSPPQVVQFKTLLQGVRSASLQIPDLVSQVKLLFAGHRDLLEGFVDFVPSKMKDEFLASIARVASKQQRSVASFTNNEAAAKRSRSDTLSRVVTTASPGGLALGELVPPAPAVVASSFTPSVAVAVAVTAPLSGTADVVMEEVAFVPTAAPPAVTASTSGGSTTSGPTCTICHEGMSVPFTAPCGHLACYDCWTTWLKSRMECPVCRQHLRQKQLRKIFFS